MLGIEPRQRIQHVEMRERVLRGPNTTVLPASHRLAIHAEAPRKAGRRKSKRAQARVNVVALVGHGAIMRRTVRRVKGGAAAAALAAAAPRIAVAP